MTAEIAIINRHAIVLAADSAVTVGREKVWKTANKLFSLGPAHDIAVMIYGSGDFLSFPWEVIVKDYRQRAASSSFNKVRDCAEDFKTFLLSSIFEGEEAQNMSVMFPLFDYMSAIADETEDDAGAHDPVLVAAKIAERRAGIARNDVLFPALTLAAFEARYRADIERYAASFFDPAVVAAVLPDLVGLAFDFFRTKTESDYASGVVVAGFGKQEYFPSLLHFTLDGRFDDTPQADGRRDSYIRWWENSDSADLNNRAVADPFPIIPFAQQDMTFLFTTGIASRHLQWIEEVLSTVMAGALGELVQNHVDAAQQLNANIAAQAIASTTTDEFMKEFRSYLVDKLIGPVRTAVSALPKEEMAAMAEALVELTSLRRKVDSKLETVGGPVDVGVISKGDGFVWVKRKHYFKPEINGDFFRRRARLLGEP